MKFFLFLKNCHGLSTIVSGFIFALMNRQLLGGNFAVFEGYNRTVFTHLTCFYNQKSSVPMLPQRTRI